MQPMRKVHYAWLVAAAGFAALLASAAFRAVAGVLMVPLQQASEAVTSA
jgi:hypothetical protein